MASIPSWTVKLISWCTVPIWSATIFAAFKSGAPFNPTEKEWSWGHHASCLSSDSILLDANFFGRADYIWMSWECYLCLPSFEKAGKIK